MRKKREKPPEPAQPPQQEAPQAEAEEQLLTPAEIEANAKKVYEEEIAALALRRKQAKANYKTTLGLISEAERKLETRRKIIFGGALVEMAAQNPQAWDILSSMVKNLTREQDKKAVAGWSMPERPNPPPDSYANHIKPLTKLLIYDEK